MVLAELTDIGLPLSLMEDWYREIEMAIENKRVSAADGSTINLKLLGEEMRVYLYLETL